MTGEQCRILRWLASHRWVRARWLDSDNLPPLQWERLRLESAVPRSRLTFHRSDLFALDAAGLTAAWKVTPAGHAALGTLLLDASATPVVTGRIEGNS